MQHRWLSIKYGREILSTKILYRSNSEWCMTISNCSSLPHTICLSKLNKRERNAYSRCHGRSQTVKAATPLRKATEYETLPAILQTEKPVRSFYVFSCRFFFVTFTFRVLQPQIFDCPFLK